MMEDACCSQYLLGYLLSYYACLKIASTKSTKLTREKLKCNLLATCVLNIL